MILFILFQPYLLNCQSKQVIHQRINLAVIGIHLALEQYFFNGGVNADKLHSGLFDECRIASRACMGLPR